MAKVYQRRLRPLPIASCGWFYSSEFQQGTRLRQGELERPQCSAKRWLPRFGEFCSRYCLSLLPGFPCSMHATWGPPFSPLLHILEWPSRGLVRSLSFPPLANFPFGVLISRRAKKKNWNSGAPRARAIEEATGVQEPKLRLPFVLLLLLRFVLHG